MNKDIRRIVQEEVRLFALGQRVLSEHKRLVAERQDFESLVILYLIEDLTGKPVDPALLSEGLWEKGKHLFSKLGSMEKSGKIFGRQKAQQDALNRFFASVDKASNKLAEKTMTQIEEKYPGFPNVERQEDFVNALIDIGEVYDTLEAQVKAGEMAAQMANPVVESLRELVVYYLDNELADVYKHLKEQDEEVRGKFTKRGAGEKDLAARSTTMQGLRSNVLPLVLAGTGAAAAILSQAPWFVDTITTTAAGNPAQAAQEIQKILGPMDGEGFTQMLGRLAQGNPAHFDASTPPKELFAAMTSLGIDPRNPKALFKLGVDPTAYAQAIASGATDIGTMFPASNQSLWLDRGSEVVTRIVKNVQKLKAGAAAGAAGTATTATAMSPAGVILGALGLGAIASGAAVKMLRVKGLKASRAQLMSELINEMPDFPIPEEEPKVDPEVVKKDPEQTPAPQPAPTPAAEPEAEEVRLDFDIFPPQRGDQEEGRDLLSLLKALRADERRLSSTQAKIVYDAIKKQLEGDGHNLFEALLAEQEQLELPFRDKRQQELPFGKKGEKGDSYEIKTDEMFAELRAADFPEDVLRKVLDTLESWAGSHTHKVTIQAQEFAEVEPEPETTPEPETPPESEPEAEPDQEEDPADEEESLVDQLKAAGAGKVEDVKDLVTGAANWSGEKSAEVRDFMVNNKAVTGLETAIAVGSFYPGLNVPASLAGSLIDITQGDPKGALFNLVALVPFGKLGGKIAARAGKYGDLVLKLADASRKLAKTAAKGQNTKTIKDNVAKELEGTNLNQADLAAGLQKLIGLYDKAMENEALADLVAGEQAAEFKEEYIDPLKAVVKAIEPKKGAGSSPRAVNRAVSDDFDPRVDESIQLDRWKVLAGIK